MTFDPEKLICSFSNDLLFQHLYALVVSQHAIVSLPTQPVALQHLLLQQTVETIDLLLVQSHGSCRRPAAGLLQFLTQASDVLLPAQVVLLPL